MKKSVKPLFLFIGTLVMSLRLGIFMRETKREGKDMDYKEESLDRPVCLECGDSLGYGRTDRKFCSDSCRNRWHNRKHHFSRLARLRILGILDRNYSILEKFLSMGMRSITLGDLAQTGYNIEYVTSYHKVGGHDEYWCFDIKYCLSSSRIFRIEKVEPKFTADASADP